THARRLAGSHPRQVPLGGAAARFPAAHALTASCLRRRACGAQAVDAGLHRHDEPRPAWLCAPGCHGLGPPLFVLALNCPPHREADPRRTTMTSPTQAERITIFTTPG